MHLCTKLLSLTSIVNVKLSNAFGRVVLLLVNSRRGCIGSGGLFIAFVLTACGGGGEPSSGSSQLQRGAQVAATTTTSQTLQTQRFVFQLNGKGDFYSAVQVGGGVPIAHSTAVALVQIALSPLPAGLSSAEVQGIIEASPSFGTLETAVEAARKTGTTPLATPEVPGLIAKITQEISSSTNGWRFKVSTTTKAQVLAALVVPQVTTPLPFTLISSRVGGPFDLNITGFGSVLGVSGIVLRNSTFIAWEAVGKDGLPVSIASNDSGVVADDMGRPFVLTVRQSAATQLENRTAVLKNAFMAIAQLSVGDLGSQASACAVDLGSAAANNADLIGAFAGGNPSLIWASLKAWDLKDAFVSSAGCASMSLGSFKTAAGAFASTMSVLSKMSVAADVAKLTAQAVQIAAFWNETQPYRVCQSFTREVVNCAVRYVPTFSENARNTTDTFFLAPGAKARVYLAAFDKDGYRTGVPAGMQMKTETANNSAILTWTDVGNERQFAMQALAQTGSETITFTEPISKLESAPLFVRVAIPSVNPPTASVKVGELQNFALSSTSEPTAKWLIDGAGITWALASRDGGAAQITVLSAFNYPMGVSVQAQAAGTVNVVVRIPLIAETLYPSGQLRIETSTASKQVMTLTLSEASRACSDIVRGVWEDGTQYVQHYCYVVVAADIDCGGLCSQGADPRTGGAIPYEFWQEYFPTECQMIGGHAGGMGSGFSPSIGATTYRSLISNNVSMYINARGAVPSGCTTQQEKFSMSIWRYGEDKAGLPAASNAVIWLAP